MNEEEYIKNRMGKRNPFTVPEGYFEQLNDRIMSRLPEKEEPKTALLKRLRPLLYAAACICVAIFSIAIYFNHAEVNNEQTAELQYEAIYSDGYIDDATDYAMLDNEDIYYSLLADM